MRHKYNALPELELAEREQRRLDAVASEDLVEALRKLGRPNYERMAYRTLLFLAVLSGTLAVLLAVEGV
jgi:hypothetical protein